MAHAYKALSKFQDGSSDSSDEGAKSSNSSSVTLGREDSPSSELPLELKSRILMLTSRGVSYRHRHFLADLHSLLPHTYKDTKLDTKSSNNYNSALNALADLHSCNYIFFLEARKHGQDLYLWLARAPNGPTIKFSVNNIHTMGELGFGGNCLKGGRGIVVFDESFEDGFAAGQEYKGLVREMLKGVFCVPKTGVKGMKPFIDRVIGVFGLDGKIWVRVYEIREAEKREVEKREVDNDKHTGSNITLVEIGLRFVLNPIIIQEGSFGGPVIYENKEYVSSNQVRRETRLLKAAKHLRRREESEGRTAKRDVLGLKARSKKKRAAWDNEILFR
ncbi:MAG: hypothetical protein Q9227_008100 [Pyrenula ochraceoflavens]